MGPSVERLLTMYLNVSVPLNKMVTMPIYGKNILIIFSRTKKASRLNLGV